MKSGHRSSYYGKSHGQMSWAITVVPAVCNSRTLESVSLDALLKAPALRFWKTKDYFYVCTAKWHAGSSQENLECTIKSFIHYPK